MNEILEKISNIGIVPVVVLDDASKAARVAEALLDGGIDCAEVTFRTEAAEESIKNISKAFPDMLLRVPSLLLRRDTIRKLWITVWEKEYRLFRDAWIRTLLKWHWLQVLIR